MAIPLLPQSLSVTFPSATTALLKWSHAADVGTLLLYDVQVDGSGWLPVPPTATRFLITGLARGALHTFNLRGVNSDGNGAVASVSGRTPIASLHNALFFKDCVNYRDTGARVRKYGETTTIVRAAADNDYETFTTETDLDINLAVDGNPTRVDAIFVKGTGIETHSAVPTGGSGTGYSHRALPSTVKNYEGTDVSTIVNGFQHDLYLLDQHWTATSVRMTFTGADARIYEVMLLQFGLEMDANGDFLDINVDFVDREGVVHTNPKGGILYDDPIHGERDKFEIDYVVKVFAGKTLLQTPEDFLYWRMDNRNCVFAMEFSRHPARVFPAVLPRDRVPIRYRTDDKTGGEIVSFRVAEQ